MNNIHKVIFKPALLQLFAFILVFSVILAQMPVQNVQAQATSPLVLTKSVEGNDFSVEVGDIIRYRIRFQCSDLIAPCGEMEIIDDLPAGLTYLPPPNSSVPAEFDIDETAPGRIVITKLDDNLLDGSQYDAVIAVRVNYDYRPTSNDIVNTVEGRTNPGTGWLDATPSTAPAISVEGFDVDTSWELTKTLFRPRIDPALDTDVTYQIQLCPTPGGNVPLHDIVIRDTLPLNAVFVSASDGGTLSSGVVTWNIPGPVTPPDCVTRYVTIQYPDAFYNIGDPIDNTVDATGEYYEEDGGLCTAPCYESPDVIEDSDIDVIHEDPNYSKADSGDPIGISGTARFILSLDTLSTNYPTNEAVLIDNLPHELEVLQVTSGGWGEEFDFVQATVQYSTDLGATWTDFGTVDYNDNATYNAAVDNITNVRWIFAYDPDGIAPFTFTEDGLPYGWQFSPNPEIRVAPRDADTHATDGVPGTLLPEVEAADLPETYNNCLLLSRESSSGATVGGTAPADCENQEITVEEDLAKLQVSKSETPGEGWDQWDDPDIEDFHPDSSVLPGDTVRYTITVDLTERSSIPLVNPTILDTLPIDTIDLVNGGLIFVREGRDALGNPTALLDGGPLPPGASVTFTHDAAADPDTLMWEFSGLTIDPQTYGSRSLTVEFYARIPRGQEPGTRTNSLYVVTDSVNAVCETGTQVNDHPSDIDGDGDTDDPACAITDDYIVERSAALRGEKWIRSINTVDNSQVVRYDTFAPPTGSQPACPDGGAIGLPLPGSTNLFTRYPCISQAYTEGALDGGVHAQPPTGNPNLDDFEYNMRIFNDGNVDMINYVLYDILPYSTDKGSGGVLASNNRLSQFRPELTGPVRFISGPPGLNAGHFTIEYNLTANPCRPEVFDEPAGSVVPNGCDNDWEDEFGIADWSTVRSYRISLNTGAGIPPSATADEVRFGVPMKIPHPDISIDDAESLEIAWNSFSHVGSYTVAGATRDLLASEPRKVGITIPERFSIGNRVWRDSDNSGTINAPDDADPGVGGVIVNLYYDADEDGSFSAAEMATPLATTITDYDTANPDIIDKGYYLFSNLLPGNYIVGIPDINFGAADPDGPGPLTQGALYRLRSSTGTPLDNKYVQMPDMDEELNLDREDHGLDPATLGAEVFSPTITLSAGDELTNEADLSDDSYDGSITGRRGVNGERNFNSDLTVDFGFFGGSDVPFSIGNHLWYDDGKDAGGAVIGTINDGIRQAGERPVVGARVNLYRDGNLNGDAEDIELIRFDVTDPNGFYLFDNLDPGNYYVKVAAGNFGDADFDPDDSGSAYNAVTPVLQGWYSSQLPNPADVESGFDSNDDGIDTNFPETYGVLSSVIVLTRGVNEPTGETHLSGDTSNASGINPTAGDGDGSLNGGNPSIGRFGETDASSNMTIDFGFIPPMSIGNRVWIDDGAGEPTFRAGYNNGVMDGSETGVSGVLVVLYNSSGTAIDTAVTDGSGYYLFERLQPGNYTVRVAPSNFSTGGVLENYLSSRGSSLSDSDTDIYDDGIDDDSYLTNGIVSSIFTMNYDVEPTNESDLINLSDREHEDNVGTYGQEDANSNLTVDFGFVLPPRSLGNRVWYDPNNNGQIDAGDDFDIVAAGDQPGIPGVTVSLYRDEDATAGTPDGPALATDTTDANGYYLFENLPPGRYLVGIDSANFASGVLVEYASSVGNVDNATSNTDSRDNGIDRILPADVTASPYGVLSTSINLSATPLSGLPTVETGSGNPLDNAANGYRGNYGELDANSDLTIDFGFFKPMSIGNRVFLDNGADGAGGTVVANINNGIMDAGEPPIAGVRVELYRDNGNGIFGAGDVLVNWDVTDAPVAGIGGGYYLFDRLPQGNYFVRIPAGNFTTAFDPDGAGPLPAAPGALLGWYSSVPTFATNADINDNGINNAHPDINGITSNMITLAPDTAPTLEAQLSGSTVNPGAPTNDDFNPTSWDGPNSRGRWNESDDNSNLTVDFGFIPPLSLGNRVWIDDGSTTTGLVLSQFNNRIMDGTEAGRANVALNLYFDANNDGVIDGTVVDGVAETTPYRTDITDADGFYLFDGLPLGRFYVQVAPSNFNGAGALVGYHSSTGVDDNDTGDINDNGQDSPTYLANGIRSMDFVLGYGGEPTDESQFSTDTGTAPGFNPTADDGPASIGRYGEVNTSSNLTADFGFISPRSLGNRVWLDNGAGAGGVANDGIINGTEAGINGVAVSLYLDNDGNGVPDGPAILTTTTSTGATGDGYYLFSNFPPGRYVVGVDAANFTTVLANMASSTNTVTPVDATLDRNDHGIDQTVPATTGIFSPSIDLRNPPAEPTGETDLSGRPADGPIGQSRGTRGEADNESDLTVDFGFRYPFSIGNRVFRDDGAGGTTANINNGIMDASELPIAGVRVELYRDNGNNTFGPEDGAAIRFDNTDAGGFYLFDNLNPGSYFVHIPDDNFGNASGVDLVPGDPLRSLYSSVPTGTENVGVAANPYIPNTDRDDNGENNARPDLYGISSSVIALALNAEPAAPTAETELSGDVVTTAGNNPTAGDGPNSRGRYGEADNNSNLTIDFGFIPPLSLGNRVWIDDGSTLTGPVLIQYNNRIMEVAEPGRDGVLLNLYFDANNDGDYDDTDVGGVNETVPYANTTTANGGYYLFDGLPPGRFYVQVAPSNFNGAGALAGFISSTGSSDVDDVDVNDNGQDSATYLADGIRSVNFILNHGTEPLTAPGVPTVETDISPLVAIYGTGNVGLFPKADADSNLTLDFGFIQPPRSIGNRVWYDPNNNGQIDAGDDFDGATVGDQPGIPGVRVSLYNDSDNNGIPDDTNGDTVFDALDAIRSDITDIPVAGVGGGYYLFSNLPPGRYLVGVDYTNFQAGQVLDEYNSSTGNQTNNTDLNDNGIDRTVPGDVTVSPYGILSNNIDLTVPAPTLEGDLSGNPADGPIGESRGTNGELDANSDLTIDFGFFKPMSIGNRVFRDDGADGAGGTVVANINNGIMDAGEPPIAGVRVELYRDDGNGTFGPEDGAAIRFDDTDAGGYYLFDNLAPVDYFVHIPAVNFDNVGDPLYSLYNSSPTGTENGGVAANPYTPNTDRDDNGVNNARPDLYGISSGVIDLEQDTEPAAPTAETELSGSTVNPGTPTDDDFDPTSWDGPNSRGRWNEGDDNSNLTIDFGFIPPLSLGNRVWIDDGSTLTGPVLIQYNNRIMEGAEAGRDGVLLNLYFDANNDGDYDDTDVGGVNETLPYANTTTANGGYYLFDNLPPGRFYVQVAPSNFAALGALDGFISSTGSFNTEDADVNDNGQDSVTYLADGIRSVNFILNHGTEPLTAPGVPTVETDISASPAYGPNNVGNFGQADADSNLTLDFGFIQPPRSLGNRVWYDPNNNGQIDAGDDFDGATAGDQPGIPDVRVSLYNDSDNNGIPDGPAQRFDVTDNGGYYLFDNLPPGRYLVGVDRDNFDNTGVGDTYTALFEYASSTGNVDNATNDTDRLDNGIDRTVPGDLIASPYGVLSTSINLLVGSPTLEADLSADTGSLPGNNPTEDDGPGSIGRYGEVDAASDLTIDFGFFKPMSIGNRVFLDNGAGNAALRNNGILNAGETPVAGVRVELWRDTGGAPGLDIANDTLLRFDITDAGGYYLFDNLAPVQYYVHIPFGNFTDSFDPDGAGPLPLAAGALYGMNNSAPDGQENIPVPGNAPIHNPDTDADDNGVYDTRPDLNGISSGVIDLVRDTEPAAPDTETELSADTGTTAGNDPTAGDGPNSRGRYGEGDNNSNLTIDFGFLPVYSLGNRVWLDTGALPSNGFMEADEAGVNGVRVNLYLDANDDGVPDDINVIGNPADDVFLTTTTDANGYYRFDNLIAGTYIVEVVPPAGMGSTVDTNQDADSNPTDLDDNGVITLTTGEVRSHPITLGDALEPTGEEPTPNPPSADGEAPDNQSNRTVDFGFVQAVAIGNVVWLDTGAGYNNGIYEPADENGVDNVTVQLFTAAGVEVPVGPDGILNTADDAPGGMLTSAGGYYRFDKLIPGNYYVYIPASEFQAGGELYTYLSSSGSGTTQDDDNNADENGIDGTPANPLTVDGISTQTYTLTPGTMPVADDDTFYSGTLPDNSVNFTADFGFAESYSLGNRVWLDTNRDGDRDDGVEPGIENIRVNLYRDTNNDNRPDGPIVHTVLTNKDGFYRFDHLTAGNYIVEVVPPTDMFSTIDAGDPDSDPDDDDDNGVFYDVATGNILSQAVTLGPGEIEPELENNPPTNPDTADGEAPDDRSNRTVDFGFYTGVITSEKQLTRTIMMDNGPAPGTDYTTTPQVAIGEILTYVVRLTIPSGEYLPDLRAIDTLDNGLAFVDCESIVVTDPGLTTSLGGYDAACNPDTNPLVTPQLGGYDDARHIEFMLGDVRNTTADTQVLTLTYNVIVLDIPSNRNGVGGLNNSIVWQSGTGRLPPSQAIPVEIVEPDLSIDKSAIPTTAPYGATIRFTIDIAHTDDSATTAFDVVVTDTLPAGLTLDPASIEVTGSASTPGNYTTDFNPATNTLTVVWAVFPLDATARITFDAVFVGPSPVVNAASVAWSSLPIDPRPDGTPVPLSPFNDYSTERWYDPADLIGLNSYNRNDSVLITTPVPVPDDDGENGKENPARLPATGFAPGVVTQLPPMPEGFAYAQTEVTLEIPKLKQTLKLAGVPYDSKKGEWNLTWLNTEAGWLETTAFPTYDGNSAITAHTTLSNGKPGPFAKLGDLAYGDQVIIHLGGQKYIFEVRTNKQVKPNEVNSTLKHEETPWLTLITCKSYNEKTGEYTYRTVARAVLVSVVDE